MLLAIALSFVQTGEASIVSIPVSRNNGSTFNLAFNGNLTTIQIINASFEANPNEGSTSISFVLTGPANTFGTANITIPKHIIPFGTIPRVLVEGHLLTRQAVATDQENYFVSLTMHFSTHNVSIYFSNQPIPTDPPPPEFPSAIASPNKAIDSSLIQVAIAVAISAIIALLGTFILRKKHARAC